MVESTNRSPERGGSTISIIHCHFIPIVTNELTQKLTQQFGQFVVAYSCAPVVALRTTFAVSDFTGVRMIR
jgi:hypothetical protein